MALDKLRKFIKNNWLYLLLILSVIALAFFIRWHNLWTYNTYWADDGGAHIDYWRILTEHHRLPALSETYLAWHEPIYYLILALWGSFGHILGYNGLNWLESLNIVFYGLFLGLVWLISYFFSQKNKWVSLANFFLFSVLFVGVKLSAYINNELLNQLLILLLVFLFYHWGLLSVGKIKRVFFWSIILGLAALVKITALIIFLAVIFVWFIYFLKTRQRFLLKYILLCLGLVCLINLPWVVYKNNHYRGYFSINIYDAKPHQNLLTSDAWQYIFAVNTHIFSDYPYWYSQPNSYFSILLSDSFGDYYNLFNVGTEYLPTSERILTGNGRYSTQQLWQTMINTNRIALLIVAVWWLGFLWWLVDVFKNKKIDGYDFFLVIVLLGGWSATLYHNLRLPYLEAGVLKAHFIYFTYPLLALLAYRQWWQVWKNKIWRFMIIFAPIIIYIFLAWQILLARAYVIIL